MSAPTASRPPSGRLIDHAGSWKFRLAVFVLWTVFIQGQMWGRIYYTGDEPHYLMSVLSFVLDKDFNLLNNFQRDDGALIGFPGLGPQFANLGYPPDRIPSEHGTIFPIILAPAWVMGNINGVRIFLLACAVVSCLLVAAAVHRLTGNGLMGTLAGALLAIAPTWQMQSSRIYPETFAGLLTTIAFFVLARHAAAPDKPLAAFALFAGSFAAAFLPVPYPKYIGPAVGLTFAFLLLPKLRIRPALWAGFLTAASIAAINVILWGDMGAIGSDALRASNHFALAGAHQRYWQPFFDRHHGIVPFQPFIFLSLWAMTSFVWRMLRRPFGDERAIVLGLASIAVLLYTAMYGPWLLRAGHSVPGRYLCTVLPLMCGLIVVWAYDSTVLRRLRFAFIGGGAAVALAFFVASTMRRGEAPYFQLLGYTYLFPRYWNTWDPATELELRPVGDIDWIVPVVLLVGTKAAAWLWAKRQRGLSNLPAAASTFD